MTRSDAASRTMTAQVGDVYAAMISREALETWLPPEGMSARFERFDPQTGGSYRLVLRYSDPTNAPGKTTTDTDIVEARFVELVPDVRVVQAVDFASDDPSFAGTMTMTWTLCAVDGGTRVDIVADNVPDGIDAADHAVGLQSSLANLARYLEEETADEIR